MRNVVGALSLRENDCFSGARSSERRFQSIGLHYSLKSELRHPTAGYQSISFLKREPDDALQISPDLTAGLKPRGLKESQQDTAFLMGACVTLS
jgi:hypothetical protein